MQTTRNGLAIADLHGRYGQGSTTPADVVSEIFDRIAARPDDRVWIALRDRESLIDQAQALQAAGPEGRPLYGVPFAIKDNIDVAGLPTTAGCPAYAYHPDESASAVQKLVDAGALPVGKTNMDQFATGLVGTRSPYGAVSNPFDSNYISGGSSSGSAVAVAAGLVSFALGTDTAGSGRVPAAFNNIIGLKPTCGRISAHGVVPACRSLDCVSVFALSAGDARSVFDVAADFDTRDSFSRPAQPSPARFDHSRCRFAVPREADLDFFGDASARALFRDQIARVTRLFGVPREVDFRPFLEAARLLYEGPWVAERYAAVGAFIDANRDETDATVRSVIANGKAVTAVEAFRAQYRLRELRQATQTVWDEADVLMTPTAATVHTIAAVADEPLSLNAGLGRYTNYVNLMDLSAVAVPSGFLESGLPFGVSLVAPAFSDHALLSLADRLHREAGLPAGATGLPLPAPRPDAEVDNAWIPLAVCGAHMSGLPLNHQLTTRGARLLRAGHTAPEYRLYALDQFDPPRPGMLRDTTGGAIEIEIWAVPASELGSFVEGIPAPLGVGTVTLDDGSEVKGFLCETFAVGNAKDITAFASWRRYLDTKWDGPQQPP